MVITQIVPGSKSFDYQTNGICERFNQTWVNEFLEHYNNERTHQWKRCQGRTPMVVGNDAKIMGEETHPKWVSGFGWLSVVFMSLAVLASLFFLLPIK